MKLRLDKEAIPSISIALGNSNESNVLGTLADTTPFVNEYSPEQINQPINYIVPPIVPKSYDQALGEITFNNASEIADVAVGMVIIDPATGNGFIVNDKPSDTVLAINPNSVLPKSQIAIIPQYPIYRARVERNFINETYSIGCHTSDPSTLIFLFSVVKYTLLRYKESLLEANNFQLSSMTCSDMNHNQSFSAENVYSRFISLSGQIEESWIKAPYRVVENVSIASGNSGNVTAFVGGIKILSQDPPSSIQSDNTESWKTIK